MEWSDVIELYRYWNESPPVHELVAGLAGFKGAGRAPEQLKRPEVSLAEMKAALDAGRKTGRA